VLDLSHTQSSIDLLFMLKHTLLRKPATRRRRFTDWWTRPGCQRWGIPGRQAVGDGGPGRRRSAGGGRRRSVDGAGPIESTPDDPDCRTSCPPACRAWPSDGLPGRHDGARVELRPACAPEDDNYQQFYTYTPPPSVEVTFIGADHTDFVAQIPLDPCNLGTADHERVKALAMEYAVAFLNDRLRGWDRFHDDYAGPESTRTSRPAT